MQEDEAGGDASGAVLRTGDRSAASEAARLMGSVRSERKKAAGQASLAKARQVLVESGVQRGRRKQDVMEIRCTCEAGESLEGHRWDCPRGQAIKRRAKEASADA